ncbi:MAG: hypothetical protein WCJ28_02725 [Actinomycetota bacterium]
MPSPRIGAPSGVDGAPETALAETDVPAELVAVTLTEYEVKFVSPEMVHDTVDVEHVVEEVPAVAVAV